MPAKKRFACDVNGCTKKFLRAQGLGVHKSTKHGIAGKARQRNNEVTVEPDYSPTEPVIVNFCCYCGCQLPNAIVGPKG